MHAATLTMGPYCMLRLLHLPVLWLYLQTLLHSGAAIWISVVMYGGKLYPPEPMHACLIQLDTYRSG